MGLKGDSKCFDTIRIKNCRVTLLLSTKLQRYVVEYQNICVMTFPIIIQRDLFLSKNYRCDHDKLRSVFSFIVSLCFNIFVLEVSYYSEYEMKLFYLILASAAK